MDLKRLKVLIIAHELSPYQGSECAEGWNLVTRLAKYHDITVLYASVSQFGNNSYLDAINKYFSKEEPIKGLTLINIDRPWFTKSIAFVNSIFEKIGPIGLPMLYFLGYKVWQKAAYKKAKLLNEHYHFDIVHQLTQISFREPGFLWKLGIPFVWGPTGGISSLPKKFLRMLPIQYRVLERIRTISNFSQFNFISRVINANKFAALIYAFSHEDAVAFKKRATGNVKLMLDAGTYTINNNIRIQPGANDKLKGIWCGQLAERKALIILLKALALDDITMEKITFKIIGNGPLKKKLLKTAMSLKLENIEWIERVNHDEVFKLMGQADIFVHSSLREATSNVIPEALSTGLPIICHDANGMSIAVNESCGIKIPLNSPEESILGFHNAIKKLIIDRDLLDKLKSGAKQRSREISWDVMAQTIAKDYLEIVQNKR
jgi:glycosyltransferase involved in cell wall biosynthesis